MAELTIAIDGPGSAGKGTVARGVARELAYQYVDTGAMYRCVALAAQRRDVSWDDAEGCAAVAHSLGFEFAWDGGDLVVRLDGEDVSRTIRTVAIGRGASDVSRHPPVRSALLDQQRALGAAGGVVMDGRDIGTVVLPDADLKVYLDADVAERARRRHAELATGGSEVTLAEVHAALEARDHQDMSRAAAPLRPADDAVIIDTTPLTIPEAIGTVLTLARERGATPRAR